MIEAVCLGLGGDIEGVLDGGLRDFEKGRRKVRPIDMAERDIALILARAGGDGGVETHTVNAFTFEMLIR